tara:strand:+ start:314 stop:679 length:366 start_codon:yes stop_codon:yes gene_type:complete
VTGVHPQVKSGQQTKSGLMVFGFCPDGATILLPLKLLFKVDWPMSWLKKPSTMRLAIGLGYSQIFIAGCLGFLTGNPAVVDRLELKSVFLTGTLVFLFGVILHLRHHPESAFTSNNHSNGT